MKCASKFTNNVSDYHQSNQLKPIDTLQPNRTGTACISNQFIAHMNSCKTKFKIICCIYLLLAEINNNDKRTKDYT